MRILAGRLYLLIPIHIHAAVVLKIFFSLARISSPVITWVRNRTGKNFPLRLDGCDNSTVQKSENAFDRKSTSSRQLLIVFRRTLYCSVRKNPDLPKFENLYPDLIVNMNSGILL